MVSVYLMIDYGLRLGLGLGLVLALWLVIAAYSVLFAIKFLACKFKDISYNYVATDVHPN